MQIIHTITEMQNLAKTWRAEGKRIGLVPTMGALHEGHLTLLDVIRPHCDMLVTSIFVNPTQFGPNEDFEKYPRDLQSDATKLSSRGCDIIFAPDTKQMYPEGYRTFINVEGLNQKLCGAFRPGHFRGVATIVAKLFHITQCHVAVFGQKDYQQALILKKMVTDLNLDVEMVIAPTVRESDGLAMSSRNAYLSTEERKQANVLFQALELANRMVQGGETNCRVIREAMISLITKRKDARIDYVSLVDPDTLEDIPEIQRPVLAALAIHIGSTRLIDNRILNSYLHR
jgi:pantoate--beta-alanine ligase